MKVIIQEEQIHTDIEHLPYLGVREGYIINVINSIYEGFYLVVKVKDQDFPEVVETSYNSSTYALVSLKDNEVISIPRFTSRCLSNIYKDSEGNKVDTTFTTHETLSIICKPYK